MDRDVWQPMIVGRVSLLQMERSEGRVGRGSVAWSCSVMANKRTTRKRLRTGLVEFRVGRESVA